MKKIINLTFSHGIILLLSGILFTSSFALKAQSCDANFTYSVGGSANKTVSFTSAGNDTLVQHEWYFGDGTTSVLINPVKTYSNYGTKTIIHLVKKGNICADTFVTNVTLISSVPCNANFTYAVGGSANKTVSFISASNDTLVQHEWYFGDGTTSALINPVKTYLNYGNKTIIHIVKKGNICADTFVTTVTLNNSIPCNANFTYSVGGSANKTVSFTSAINDTLVQHEWYFGDGTTSALINPVKTYLNYGTKTIIHLVKKGNICADTFITTVTLNNSTQCVANFVDTIVGNTVHFNNKSTGNNLSYFWNFGNGTSSTQANPVHTFTQSGVYMVCLQVANLKDSCTKTHCDSVLITNGGTNIKHLDAITLYAIYPIPANDEINLDLNSLYNQEANLSIIDMTGKVCINKVYKTAIGQNNIKLDISELFAGVYIIQINIPQGKIIHKMIK